MTPDILLQSLEEILTPPLKAAGGAVTVCSDRMHAYEVLLGAPANAYRAAVSLAGMKPAGNPGANVWSGPAVEVEITIAVIRAAGLTMNPGKSVYRESKSGGLSLLQRGEQVRRLMAGARWAEDSTGQMRGDVDPAGCRFDGARVIHLEAGEPDSGFLPVAEMTFRLMIVLPVPEDADFQDWIESDPFRIADQTANVTLPAGPITDRADTLTFEQSTPGFNITLAAPSDGSRKVITIKHEGTAAFTLGPVGNDPAPTIEPGTSDAYHWDSDAGNWASGA